MVPRSAPWWFTSLGLLLLAGCVYPIRQRVDEDVCALADVPMDRQPLTAADVAPPMPPAQNGQNAGITRTSYQLPAADPVAQGLGWKERLPDQLPLVSEQAPRPSPLPGGQAGGGAQPGKPGEPGSTGQKGSPQLEREQAREAGVPPRQILTVPSELMPRGFVPPLVPFLPRGPRETDVDYAARSRRHTRESLRKELAALPPVPPDPVAVPGPLGRPLTLADLHRLARANSPQLRQAVAYVQAQRGAAVQAGLPPNPTIGYEGDTAGTTGGAGYQGAYFDQVFKTMNKLQLARAIATMDLRNAEVALRRAEMDLATNVRRGYFNILVALESMRVNRALVRFTTEVYDIQVASANIGGFAAGYEPVYLRVLANQSRVGLITARNAYVAAWKTLGASMGMTGMPITQLAGRIDIPIPVYNWGAVQARVLHNHTDVLTAFNTLEQSKLSLRLAQVTPIPDFELKFLLQKDYTGPPFELAHSVQLSMPLPVWNRNQGGIMQAQGNLVSSSEGPHTAQVNLSNTLADAFNRYQTNRDVLALYRDKILPDQVRVYQGVYERYRKELAATGAALPPGLAAGGTPAFNDIIVAQGNLGGAVSGYVTALGALWTAVVDVTDLLQTYDMFRIDKELVPTQEVAPLPDLDKMLAQLPCCHPCSPVQEHHLRKVDPYWPPALGPEGARPMPPASGPPALKKEEATPVPPLGRQPPPAAPPAPGNAALLEPPPAVPRRLTGAPGGG